jgi:hypothetical protein
LYSFLYLIKLTLSNMIEELDKFLIILNDSR